MLATFRVAKKDAHGRDGSPWVEQVNTRGRRCCCGCAIPKSNTTSCQQPRSLAIRRAAAALPLPVSQTDMPSQTSVAALRLQVSLWLLPFVF